MLWRVLVLAVTVCFRAGSCQLGVPEEPNVLTPPYFNIATGKKIESTASCGEDRLQIFCNLTGEPNEYDGQICDYCDAADPTKSHPIKYAIDGTEKWWQSPPLSQGQEYNKINITIHLGQVFHVAYTIIKFANSPRAGTWVLERSSDHGKTYQPWQYFANSDNDCDNLFGIDAFEEITRDDSVICTSEYSDVVPLESGEVIVSMIKDRPGAKNFSHSPVLQEWSKATDVRLRLLRTVTLHGHLMAVRSQDPTVTRRYYYSIKDISIGGRCVCNGHADTCAPDPFDKYKLKCDCRHNTCGDSCDRCCPGFVQKAWMAAVPESSNECEPCNCHGHSVSCFYDKDVDSRQVSMDMDRNYEGGGVCVNCTHNTAGINCEKCVDGYCRPADVDLGDPYGCRPCECDSNFTVGTREPVTGRCYCKPQFDGDRCDRCAQGYHNFPECAPCPCVYMATRDGVCMPIDGVCPCKYNYAGMYCDECQIGFYDFPNCIPCACHGQGATNENCDQYTGQCICEEGYGGRECDERDAGPPASLADPKCWRFCGIDSYLRVSQEQLVQLGQASTGTVVDYIFFKMLTIQKNGLLFLVGQDKVGAMCNKSMQTNGRMLRLDANTTSLVDDGEQFTVAAKELLQKLIDESSGDSEEYLQNLVKAEMLIARMKERIFKPMQDIADAELLEAEELFSLVNVNFTLPADDIRTRVEKVSQDLTDKLNKMKELRTRLNDATNAVTEVDTLNAANSKALLAARDAVDRIIAEWEIVNNLVKDSQVILNGDSPGDLLVLGTEELNRETLRLQDEYDSMVAGLEGKKELVDQAKEKALMLQNDADELQRLVEETKNDPRNVRAVEAANRYQNIVNTIEKAREAASMADLDATEANKTVKEEKLEEAARVANDDSGKLLALVQDYQNNEVSRARDDLDGAKSTKNVLDESVTNLSNKLDAVDNGITNLNPGETNEKLQATRDKTKEANDLIAMVNEQAAALEESANNAPSPDIPLSDEIGAVEEILGNLEGDIDDVKGEIVSIKQKAARIKLLPRNLQLDDKIKEIRKRIELSRSRADSVGVSMEFKSKPLTKGVHPEYAQVYIPRQSFLLADSMEIDVYVNISKAGDNSLLYLGDQSTEDGDYVALETIGGRVYYYYKVGDGVGELRSNVAINDEEWHRVVIQRNGGNAMLTVHYMDPSPPRGDSLPSDLELTDVQTGTLDTDMLQASLGMADSAFIIGGNPLEPTPGRLQNKQMDGCITNVKVNGELVGIWDFISYNGPVPGRTCKASPPASTADPKCWRFRGIDSYLRVSQEQLVQLGQASSGTVVDYIFFKMLTNEKNGLLFLVGKDKSQFYALENRDDKFVLTYNFGWDEPKSAASPNNLPGLSTCEQYVNVKFAILRRRNPPLAYLIFNNSPVPVIQFTLPDTANVQGDVWFGGVHRNEGNEQFLPYVPNVNNNFRGCITQMKFHYLAQYYNVYEAKERLGVFPGCDLDMDMVPDIDPEVETGHVSVGKDVPYIGITDQPQDGDDGDGGGDGDDDTVTDEPVITTTTEV